MAKSSKLKRGQAAKPAAKPVKRAIKAKAAKPTMKAMPKGASKASRSVTATSKKSSAKTVVKKVIKAVSRKVATIASRGKTSVSKKTAPKPPSKAGAGSKIAKRVVAKAASPAAIKTAVRSNGAVPPVMGGAKGNAKSKNRNSGMPTSKVTPKEIAPGGGLVQPATKSAPAMRLRADDAEILATAKERYSTKDLDQFRKLILEQQLEAREEFDILSQNILDTSGEFEADNQTYSLHTAEQGTDAIEREKTFLHAQRTSDYIKKLDEAIERIDRGTYGICVICGGLIEKQRLQAVPITQKHVDCKNRTNTRRPAESGQREMEEPAANIE